MNVDISNLREKQKERFLNLAEFLKDLAASAVRDLGDGYRTLDRAEAVIASLDSSKQLRGDMMIRDHTISFNQNHSSVTAFFTIAEVIQIAKALQRHIEKHLEYPIKYRICLEVADSDEE